MYQSKNVVAEVWEFMDSIGIQLPKVDKRLVILEVYRRVG